MSFFLFFSRYFSVHDVVSMLEDGPDFDNADIFIEPPACQVDTDEDSGDEDEAGTISNLNRNQLQAPATVTLWGDGGKRTPS